MHWGDQRHGAHDWLVPDSKSDPWHGIVPQAPVGKAKLIKNKNDSKSNHRDKDHV